MPMFCYRCGACGHEAQQFVQASTQPTCPACGAADLQKVLTSFAVGAGPAKPVPFKPCSGRRSPCGAGACKMN